MGVPSQASMPMSQFQVWVSPITKTRQLMLIRPLPDGFKELVYLGNL